MRLVLLQMPISSDAGAKAHCVFVFAADACSVSHVRCDDHSSDAGANPKFGSFVLQTRSRARGAHARGARDPLASRCHFWQRLIRQIGPVRFLGTFQLSTVVLKFRNRPNRTLEVDPLLRLPVNVGRKVPALLESSRESAGDPSLVRRGVRHHFGARFSRGARLLRVAIAAADQRHQHRQLRLEHDDAFAQRCDRLVDHHRELDALLRQALAPIASI